MVLAHCCTFVSLLRKLSVAGLSTTLIKSLLQQFGPVLVLEYFLSWHVDL